jgi:hypothetical protein
MLGINFADEEGLRSLIRTVKNCKKLRGILSIVFLSFKLFRPCFVVSTAVYEMKQEQAMKKY